MHRLFAPGLLVVLPFLAGALFAADLNKSSMEYRKNFIDTFTRTGLNTTPGDAMMLRILVESRGAKRGIEVGAASGFGAINMGIAFERTGGHLYSLEIDPKAVVETRGNLEKVGLEKTVTVMEGDALQTLGKLTGQFDFIFIDAAKSQYLGYLKAIEPKLAKGALVVADNVIKSERAMKDFLEYIQGNAGYETVIIRSSLEKGDGMLIAYKVR
jgi:predicted O-methyltransferase YrrM